MPAAPRSDSELSEFLLRACHDLRGPLRALRIHCELLAQRNATEPADDPDQSLAFVLSGAAAAVAVVDGIADYALALAIDTARFQRVPLDVMFRVALAKLSPRILESAAEVAYDNLPSVKGDADRLVQLFEYLVDHALRQRGSGPASIRIAAELQNGAWLFTLSDSPGLTVDNLEGAFTPFARLYANQRPGPGLATCRAIVERHGGKMWAESAAGAGCVLRFTLPALTEP